MEAPFLSPCTGFVWKASGTGHLAQEIKRAQVLELLHVSELLAERLIRIPRLMDALALAEVGRAVADPTRNEVLSLSNGKLSISDIGRLLGVSRATASHHVAVLQRAGLVEIVPAGRCRRPRRAARGVRVLMMELSGDPG